MKMSRILLLVVALVAGGLAAFLATRTPEAPPVQPTDPKIIEEARTQVLVATAPIGVGQRLATSNIQWRDWPEGAVLDDYITKKAMPEALTEMQGSVARFEIFEGDPVRQQKLIKSSQGYLSAVLSQGMRGVSISVNAESASGGFVVPNDHVDVVLTRKSESGPARAETILSNVRVLAIDKRLGEIGASGGKTNPDDPSAEVFSNSAIATLELDPGQAETVINATQLGQLSLALRSIVDFDRTADDNAANSRNAAIRVIRYGVEDSVVTTAPTGAQVNPVAYSAPATETQSSVELRPSVSDEQAVEQ